MPCDVIFSVAQKLNTIRFIYAQLPRSVMCCQVTETEKKCDKNRMTHSVHGAGLGVEGGKVSEPPRTLAMEVFIIMGRSPGNEIF